MDKRNTEWLSEEYETPIDARMVNFALVDLYDMW